jgi:hypothetical protein
MSFGLLTLPIYRNPCVEMTEDEVRTKFKDILRENQFSPSVATLSIFEGTKAGSLSVSVYETTDNVQIVHNIICYCNFTFQ